MKLHTNNFPVQVSGADSGTSQFSIAMNAKAFRVLSDTLYQDKIGSLVREISTNAYDGHIMANKQDVPFEIHLPDNFEPWFSVKDFGVGLSPESISKVFTTYFMSTKDESNNTVGAFGLGAKTPFAYTDQFTITSVHAGVKTIYSAYIDGSGIPNIAEMHSEETTEGNGVEIKVAVSSKDFFNFADAAAHQLRFFKVKPVVLNCSGFQFVEITEPTQQSIIGPDYFVTPLRSEIVAIQGQIGYEVERSKILESLASNETEIRTLLKTSLSIRIEFPIGDIGVTASRENIEYDDRTIANIVSKLKTIRKEISDNVEKNLAEADTGWDKAMLLSQLYSHFKASTTLNYDNLKQGYRGEYYVDLSNLGYKFFSCNQRSGYGTFNRYAVNQLHVRPNTKIMFIETIKPKTEALTKVWTNHQTSLYLVFVDKTADIQAIKDKITAHTHGFNNFFEQKDFVEKKVRSTSSVVRQKTNYFKVFSEHNWVRQHNVDLPDEFVYVEANRSSFKNPSDAANVNIFNRLKALPMFEDYKDFQIVAVPVSGMKALKDSGGISLSEVMEKIKEETDLAEIKANVRATRIYSAAIGVLNSCPDGIIRQAVVESSTKYGKLVKLASKAVTRYQSQAYNYDEYIAQFFNLNYKSAMQRADKKATVLKSELPILKVFSHTLMTTFNKEQLVKFLEVTV